MLTYALCPQFVTNTPYHQSRNRPPDAPSALCIRVNPPI